MFFGSIQIVKYLQLNDVALNPLLWLFVIHSSNPELIHFLEENHDLTYDKTYQKCFNESFKCFHNDIARYIQDNLLGKSATNNSFSSDLVVFYNFDFFPNDIENEMLFSCLRKYDYLLLANIVIKGLYINKALFDEDTPLYTAIEEGNQKIFQLLLAKQELDINLKSTIHYYEKKYEYEYEKQHEDDQSEKSDVGYEDDNGEEGEYENDEGFFYECQKYKDEITPLYAAIEEGNQGIVQFLLTKQELDINLKSTIHYYEGSYDEITPLHFLLKIRILLKTPTFLILWRNLK